ncbi:MAG TPA: hypothetical protein VG842_00465 [Sediminibacterium sp.]|nr:hypothetical protein [Sediminibacterium sp.]
MLIAEAMLRPDNCNAQATAENNQQWQLIARLPASAGAGKNNGLAGMYGAAIPEGVLLAGGSDFPDKMPWQGGTKAYYNQLFLLTEDRGHFDCRLLKDTLPLPMAYGASIPVPGGALFIGGENTAGPLNKVLFLQFDSVTDKIHIKELPGLPEKLSHLSATILHQKIYTVGGEGKAGTTTCFFSMDLSHPQPKWKKEKDLPLPLAFAVTVSERHSGVDYVYVIGGRSATDSGISTLQGAVYRFNTITNNWGQIAMVPSETGHLSAAAGVSLGDDQILVIGGDDGVIFSQIENLNRRIAMAKDDQTKRAYEKEKMKLVLDHPGFSKHAWIFDSDKTVWKPAGILPYAPVTTTAILWQKYIILPGGEIHPGIRSANIMLGKLH